MRLLVLFCIVPCLASSQDPWKDIYAEKAWTDRDQWQKAVEIIKHLNLNEGARVADIGCHEGYMTVKLSRAVGTAGKVYAVDVEQNKLDRLKENLAKRNINNVISIKGEYDDPKLPLNTLDAVLILDTYHEMDNHDQILQHVKKALKPGGRLVLCEPIATQRRTQSRSDQERKHELGMNYTLQDLEKAGFKIVFKKDPFTDREKVKGDKMWLVVATR
jgi:ubiquinone/menaquinone biosynthesis C-methylase UbiE